MSLIPDPSRDGHDGRERARIVSTVALAALTAITGGVVPAAHAAEASAARVSLIGRAVPDLAKLPPGAWRDLVAYGEALSTRTFAHIGPEVADPKLRLAGNNLACTSCHQQGGTKPFAMPWIGVTASFPQYRAREDDISTVEDRVNGCMQRSMNGSPLALDSREMRAFVAYIAFLSAGVPVGAEIEGAATLQSKVPNRRADPLAGQAVYAAKCAACHGANGEGQRVGRKGDAQGYNFPPLWGPDSFNTGAGMNRLLMATRYIRHNMPLGASHTAALLSDDEAYDAAAFVLSQPRPVKARLEADFPARWNKPIDAAFPPYVLGFPPEQHRFGPFPPMAEKQRQLAAQRAAPAASAPR